MSTYFYPFNYPISSARLEEGPGHDIIHVWQDHAKMGELVATKGTGPSIISMFRSDRAVFHALFGGDTLGTVVHPINGNNLKLNDYVLDDSGKLYTVADVFALAGKGKKV